MRYLLVLLISVISISLANAQAKESQSASEILHQMEKLSNTTRVLYVAAHPDDENTGFIAYVENGKKFDAAYLSLTRGDGGQNVIGPELREALGLIRTQELLAARSIDGGEQFFSRANDFGYSKNPDETFIKWGKEAVLSDVVWAIRNFQPDLIVTRFNETPGLTHGHHTASAILAKEAFTLAANQNAFPEQLKWVDTWQAKKMYWNTSSWFFKRNEDFDKSQYIKESTGGYSALLGISYTEMAALSRSKHKSQAFGTSGSRGDNMEYFEYWKGPENETQLFDGIGSGWAHFKNGDKIQNLINTIIKDFEPDQPEASVQKLFKLKQLIAKLDDSAVKDDKLEAIDELIINCTGLYHLLYYDKPYASPGDELKLNLELVNRSNLEMQLISSEIIPLKKEVAISASLESNQVDVEEFSINIPADFPYSNPYWLDKPSSNGLYHVEDQQLIGLAENEPAIESQITVEIEGNRLTFNSPLRYKDSDRIKGEIIQPLYIVPALSIEFEEAVSIFTASGQEKEIQVKVEALKDDVSGVLELELPEGWTANTDNQALSFEDLDKNNSKKFTLTLSSGDKEGTFALKAQAKVDGDILDKNVQEIQYDHIPNQVIVSDAQQKLVLSDVKIDGKKIGYIEGAGDAVDDAAQAMGYEVETINIATITAEELAHYDAIVAGIRAYNVNRDLQSHFDKLNQYMKAGGIYLVQYNTTYSLPDTDFWPYSLTLSRDRITVEEATMDFVSPKHAALNYPNKITAHDFEGWVQERGLYFPSEWSQEYTPILVGNDPNESPKKGSVLIAEYGKGKFVYTGLSFFRELPAGVSGAYRLFANLLAPKL